MSIMHAYKYLPGTYVCHLQDISYQVQYSTNKMWGGKENKKRRKKKKIGEKEGRIQVVYITSYKKYTKKEHR